MEMKLVRSCFAAAVASLTIGLTVTAAVAQADYPNRPVKLVVGFTPGSAADVTARSLANRLSQSLGQQVVVEFKPGAASSIAAEYVVRSPKDGYTLFLLSTANITNAAINPKLSFDVVKDFAPIAPVNTVAVALVVPPMVPAKDVKELIALAKAKPGELLYASTGVGAAPHLSGELLAMKAGLKLVHVPYQGSPQAVTDLLAGRVTMMFSPASTVVGNVAAGKLRLLATAGRQRPGSLPDTPTMIESGLPDFDTAITFGLAAPAGTPKPIVDKLAAAVREATRSPELVKAWRPQAIDPLEGGPDDYARTIASDFKRWTDVAVAAGLKK